MDLKQIAEAVRPLAVRGPLDREIQGIASDSRQVRAGYLFAALPGGRQDGADFMEDAVTRGAVAVLTERGGAVWRDATTLEVSDARQAVAEAAVLFHGDPAARLQMAGITGTNGKTSTAFMIWEALEAAGRSPGLVGTVEYRIGARVIPAVRTTPPAVALQEILARMEQSGRRSAVLEVSSHALEQKRVWGVDFDVAVFTNLSHDHLDYHRSMGEYFSAKRRLFEWLGGGRKRAAAVINIDDSWGRKLAATPGIRAELCTYGGRAEAHVRAADISLSPAGSQFRVISPWGEAGITLRLLGRFNVSNALAAIAACGTLGLELDFVADVLSRLQSVPGRLESIPTRRGFRVFVDYAHTDDALSNVLRTLRELTAGRLIVVFGCGGNRDVTKRPVMGAVAAELADHSILTNDNPRREDPARILAQVSEGFGARQNYEIIEDRESAIVRAVGLAQKGDTVLIAGKGHEPFQEFANTVIPFDDRAVVRRVLAGKKP